MGVFKRILNIFPYSIHCSSCTICSSLCLYHGFWTRLEEIGLTGFFHNMIQFLTSFIYRCAEPAFVLSKQVGKFLPLDALSSFIQDSLHAGLHTIRDATSTFILSLHDMSSCNDST